MASLDSASYVLVEYIQNVGETIVDIFGGSRAARDLLKGTHTQGKKNTSATIHIRRTEIAFAILRLGGADTRPRQAGRMISPTT